MPLEGFPTLCEERAKIIVSRDRGQPQEHRAYNKDSSWVTHYLIDGGVLPRSHEPQSDFLLINEDKKSAYLIELKGAQLTHAVKQLAATEERLRLHLRSYTLHFRVVTSRTSTHAINDSVVRNFMRKWPNRLLYKTNRLEEDI